MRTTYSILFPAVVVHQIRTKYLLIPWKMKKMLNLYYHKTKYVSVGTLLYRSIRFGILVSNVISKSKKEIKMEYTYSSKIFFFKWSSEENNMNWIKLQIEIIFLRVVREIRMNYMNSYQKLPLFCKKTTLLRILSRLLSAFVKTILLTT